MKPDLGLPDYVLILVGVILLVLMPSLFDMSHDAEQWGSVHGTVAGRP